MSRAFPSSDAMHFSPSRLFSCTCTSTWGGLDPSGARDSTSCYSHCMDYDQLLELRHHLQTTINHIDTQLETQFAQHMQDDPRLPVLADYLTTVNLPMTAWKLYYAIQAHMASSNLPVPTHKQAAQLLQALGYRKVKREAGITWTPPKPPTPSTAP